MEILGAIIYCLGAGLRAIGRFFCMIGEGMKPTQSASRWEEAAKKAKQRKIH